ncbi:hypothetical protein [Thermovenabulum sp.]|uniref:hypothetical protein n=1 Tax=Thermovenabulum sp. TaxID=3100335 RepID=UPI003C7A15CF
MMRIGHIDGKFYLGIFIILSSLFLILSSRAELSGQEIPSPNWDNARKTFELFLRKPSILTAWEFLHSIPVNEGADVDKGKFVEYLGDYHRRYEIIILEMEAGNKYAARAALRLLPFLEGELKDKLIVSLSELVRINPEVFLRACYEESGNSFIRINGYPVTQLSEVMKYNKDRAFYELLMRKKALQSVKDMELCKIRNKCIQDIEKKMKELGLKGLACGKESLKSSGDLNKDIKTAFDEVFRVPCPENIRKLIDLLPEKINYGVVKLAKQLMFPERKSPAYEGPEGFELIGHEIVCGNVEAIELVLILSKHFYGIEYFIVRGTISSLILINPALFIEILAEYQEFLRNDDRIIGFCNEQIYCDYPSESIGPFILEKRVAALTSLNMPQYKDLIDYCVSVMKEEIKVLGK